MVATAALGATPVATATQNKEALVGGGDTDWERVALMRRSHKARMKLLKEEAQDLASAIAAGRKRLRVEEMALVINALRNYDPK